MGCNQSLDFEFPNGVRLSSIKAKGRLLEEDAFAEEDRTSPCSWKRLSGVPDGVPKPPDRKTHNSYVRELNKFLDDLCQDRYELRNRVEVKRFGAKARVIVSEAL
eukprot:Skav230386  [mRNA]  locus=scaffold62:307003:309978:- [translate_table: standard]